MKIRNKKGITLIALVVTIIVLLILAGTAIAMLTGENGIINKSTEASLMTKISEIEEKAMLIYNELMMNQDKKLSNEEMQGVIIKELKKQGYQTYEETEGESFEEIVLNTKEINSIKKGDTAQIEVEIRETSKIAKYYIIVENKYYLMKINQNKIIIGRESSDIHAGVEIEKEIEAESDNEECISVEEIKDNIITIKCNRYGEANITIKYGNSEPQSCHVTAKDGNFPITINYNEKEYYKYSETLEVSIKYETEVPIDASTVIANETIKITNENGADAKITSIQNLEKETILEINVGNKSGEFAISVDGIENQNKEPIVPNTSNRILVGNRMQRMVLEAKNVSSINLDLSSVCENMFDDDITTYTHWGGYSGSTEIKFKKSEKIKKISIWTGSWPASSYVIKIYGLQENKWNEIKQFSGNLPSTYGEFESLIEGTFTEGVYDGIKIDLSYSSSHVGISELVVE